MANQLRLLWHGRMVRLLFADLYQQEGLDHSDQLDVKTSSAASASSALSKSPRFRLTEQTASERRAVKGLLPANLPSFVSRQHDRGFSDRFGLSVFLRQLKGRGPSRKGCSDSSRSKYPHHLSRDNDSIGPEQIPNSINAVCMLYCFAIGSLKEIRNDILAG